MFVRLMLVFFMIVFVMGFAGRVIMFVIMLVFGFHPFDDFFVYEVDVVHQAHNRFIGRIDRF